jgi:hypothetical protein
MEINQQPISSQTPATPPPTPKQNWFDTMHIVTYVIVVACIGLIAWAILKPANEEVATNSDNINLEETDHEESNELEIKEWGIVITKPEGLEDLEYSLSSDPNSIGFTTARLAAYEDCSAKTGALGSLMKSATATSIIGEPLPSSSYVKIDTNYYYYLTPQDRCTDNSAGETLQSQQRTLIRESILKSLHVEGSAETHDESEEEHED